MSAEALVHVARAAAADVPGGTSWMTKAEEDVHGDLRVERRAADWRLGRWVAKAAVAAALGEEDCEPEEIEVLARPGGAPAARLLRGGEPRRVSVSLSHSGGIGFAASALGSLRIGCDVETLEPRSAEFVADYFTDAERMWIEAERDAHSLRANLLWSAKESALKALGEGLRLDTRSVEVEALAPARGEPDEWCGLAIAVPGGGTFPGLWQVQDGRAWTIAVEGPFRVI